MSPAGLRGLLLLSVLAALATIGLKSTAYLLTGSVGLLSDALESGVNLFAAIAAYLALRYAHRPVDATHTYGHEKIEFFSSGLEGLLIVLAGGGTAWIAIVRLINPTPITSLGLGTSLSLSASVINLAMGLVLIRVGRSNNSIVLSANGKHLLADVWTSVAVIAGLVIVWVSGFYVLDPIIAILVGTHIAFTGFGLIRRSFDGLMDHALSSEQQEKLRVTIRENTPAGTTFHALRTRQAGTRTFGDFHLLVPGKTTVREGHDLGLKVEEAIQLVLPGIEVTIHIEPIEDRASWEDNSLKGIEPGG